jgi:hypothetical protein
MTDKQGRPELPGHADGLNNGGVGKIRKIRGTKDAIKMYFHN